MAEPSTSDAEAGTRPIGVFALPFGHLLLPEVGEASAIRAGLLAGRLPDAWPATLRGHELALAQDFDGALAAFAGDGPIERYNRFVIEPGTVDAEALRGDFPELAVLVDLVRFTTGQIEDPPAVPAGGDLRSLVLAAHAAAAAGTGTAEGIADAVDLLRSAVDSAPAAHPVLRGVLH